MHAVAVPPFRSIERSPMYSEQQNVNGWTVIREPRTHSNSEDSYSDDGDHQDMDVDRRPPPYQQQPDWYHRDVRVNTTPSFPTWSEHHHIPLSQSPTSASHYGDMKYRDQQQQHSGPYHLPPLTSSSSSSSSSSRRSPTLPVQLSLPIPPTLPFPSSKSPVSAPPHVTDGHHSGLLHPYHPASAHPSSHRDRDRDYPRPKLPPPAVLEAYHHHSPHSPHSPATALSAALANSNLHHGHHVSPPPSSPKSIVYTDDATTKLGSYIRRRCFNCHTPDSAAWRRSSMHPGKVLCNKCGLYERTHQKDRPHDPAELRSKPRKGGMSGNGSGSTKLAGPGVSGTSNNNTSGATTPVDVPPRPVHASLMTSTQDDQSRRNPHSLGALLNHGGSGSPTPSSTSPGAKPLHLSPVLPPPQPYSPHPDDRSSFSQRRSSGSEGRHSPRDYDEEHGSRRGQYDDDVPRRYEERERERERTQHERKRRPSSEERR